MAAPTASQSWRRDLGGSGTSCAEVSAIFTATSGVVRVGRTRTPEPAVTVSDTEASIRLTGVDEMFFA
jgi:hypothetical protein